MAAASHPDGGTKTRQEDEEWEEEQPGAEAAEDRISALPEALRLQVLCLLPLKSAIRTGVLSTQWEALWTLRWPAPSSLDFRFAAYESSQPITETLERRGLRRLDRFALSFGIGELEEEDFRRCLDYAAACAVEDLRVHHANPAFPNFAFQFRLQLDDPHLTRLSLRGITICTPLRSCAFPALEVIQLRRVYVSDITVQLLVAACPLRSLDLRYCAGLNFVSIVGAGAHLTSLTVAECPLLTIISAYGAFSLRSFRYSGSYIAAYSIPATSALADLCICFRRHAPEWMIGLNAYYYALLQLPARGYQCAPKKELSGIRIRGRDGPVEELSEGEPPEEAELDEELSEEDLSEGPGEDELEDELSEGEAPKEDELEEQPSEEEVPEEDELDEDQSEAFENLFLLKMINFRGRDNEMWLPYTVTAELVAADTKC
ncbi:hypothetical protein ACQ4PT_040774 [Festuca glaucescens]